jgi:hypothetical protein
MDPGVFAFDCDRDWSAAAPTPAEKGIETTSALRRGFTDPFDVQRLKDGGSVNRRYLPIAVW